ncbi:unnamed protein product [Urochloa humidicola]
MIYLHCYRSRYKIHEDDQRQIHVSMSLEEEGFSTQTRSSLPEGTNRNSRDQEVNGGTPCEASPPTGYSLRKKGARCILAYLYN